MSKLKKVVVGLGPAVVVVGAQFAEHLKDPFAGKALDMPAVAATIASTTTSTTAYTIVTYSPITEYVSEPPRKPGTTQGSI
jgi:hypothetical protein